MEDNAVRSALSDFQHFRRSLFNLYTFEGARLCEKTMPWGRGSTWGYWLAEWKNHRTTAERSAASIGEDEIKLFYDCCQILQPRVSYIIGNSFGLSTFALALAWPKGHVVAIDNWSEPNTGTANRRLTETIIARRGIRNITLVTGTSPRDTASALERALAGKRLDLVFIDGLHRDHAARADYDGLAPFLGPESSVFWHNVNSVPRAFESAFRDHGSALFTDRAVLHTHGPMGVFFSRRAQPELAAYLESSRLAWAAWERGIALFENSHLLSSAIRQRRSMLGRIRRKLAAPLRVVGRPPVS